MINFHNMPNVLHWELKNPNLEYDVVAVSCIFIKKPDINCGSNSFFAIIIKSWLDKKHTNRKWYLVFYCHPFKLLMLPSFKWICWMRWRLNNAAFSASKRVISSFSLIYVKCFLPVFPAMVPETGRVVSKKHIDGEQRHWGQSVF